MIDIKQPEEERNGLIYDDLIPETPPKIVKIVDSRAIRIENELHELNKTLKDILKEMRKRKNMSELENMYVSFRQEIDTYAAELIVNNLESRSVIYEGKTVGFLILDDDYLDSFYIMPEYRRKGIGREFIKSEYRKDMCRWHELAVVKTNYAALAFWKSVFNLRRISSNFCDLHYEILGLKGLDYDT